MYVNLSQWMGLVAAFAAAFLFYMQLVLTLQSHLPLGEAMAKPSNLGGMGIALVIGALSWGRLLLVYYTDSPDSP